MPEFSLHFEVPDPNAIQLPAHRLQSGGRYAVELHDGDIYLSGNSEGLLYLAEVLIRCAKGGYADSFHVHLPLRSDAGPPPATEVQPELVIFAGEM